MTPVSPECDIQPRSSTGSLGRKNRLKSSTPTHGDAECVHVRLQRLWPVPGIRNVTGQRECQLETLPVTLRKSAAPLPPEQVQIKSCILSLNIFIETLKLRYLNYILAVLQEPCCPEPIDAYISRPNERQNGDGGINGSVPNFPQPPSSNQII